ncbi:DUF2142 domain-containing protein [Candidatus Saccharibacteria bacterium]|nr:DUF2142 domain-containing protein [Candidatus Saccharibacteria bacterium]
MKNFGAKSKKFFKQNYKSLILLFCLSIFNLVLLCIGFKAHNLTFGKTFILFVIVSILLEIALTATVYFANRHSWKIEKLFLILASIVGVIYVFAVPIGRTPDEASHFFRIYEITEGHFVSETPTDGAMPGSNEPVEIGIVDEYANRNVTYAKIIESLGTTTGEETAFITTSAYGYSFISYLPQTIGMGIGKIFHAPFLVSAYLAKIANLIFCIGILFFCIKYIPFLKKIIFFIVFLPISMQAMSSLSADAPIFVSAIALVTFVLHSIYTRKTPFTKKHFFILLALCIFITIGKIVYAPLLVLLFAIPKERFGTKKQKVFWAIGLGSLVMMVYLIWHFASPTTITNDGPAQLSNIIHNPLLLPATIIYSISRNVVLYISGAFGGYLEWFNITPTMIYIIASYTVFVILCYKARLSFNIQKLLKILSCFAVFATTVAIFTAMYITWTKSGESIIDGVQGRYFLPIMLLIPICFLKIGSRSTTSKTIIEDNSSIISNKDYPLYIFIICETVYVISTIATTHL